MYIKSVIIDGFKSYGRRTEIHGFDREFTAITGLNGTGKSNILDAICFVMGINNLGQVRATSLQDLVFKSGQAGVTKATVTLVFDNSDPDQCPLGYETFREISVTRQIILGGKNRYLINGKLVQNKKVTDFFCSVKLNVNNSNFLIMQGRITKVLNMKPHEILSMVEEAAGTSMYESKREATTKIIEKKDAKVREVNTLLKEEVEPKMEKLRREREVYQEFQKLSRDIDSLTRIYISYLYLKQKEELKAAEETIDNRVNLIEEFKKAIIENDQEIVILEQIAKEAQYKVDVESGGDLKLLEDQLEVEMKDEAQSRGQISSAKGAIDQEEKKAKALEKNIDVDERALNQKVQQMQNVEGLFQSLKEADQLDSKAYEDAQKKFEAVTQGLSTDEDGQATSLQDQLINAKKQLSEAQTTIKTSDMELRYNRSLLTQKENETQISDASYMKDKKMHDLIAEEIQKLMAKMSRLNYQEGSFESLQHRKNTLVRDIRNCQQQLDLSNAYRYEMKYRDPEAHFDRSKVRGMVGKLFSVRDESNSLALVMCAGGNLYSHVTDDDVTSKKILQKGQLQQRVTIIPINKISSHPIDPQVVRFAQNLVGEDNVDSALSLIEYDQCFDPVMKFVFGHTLICKDLDIAKQVTYHRQIYCRSVTLDGDVVDPEGTLSGGSKPKCGNILQELAQIKQYENQIRIRKNELQQIDHQLAATENLAKAFNSAKERAELRQHELNACAQRLAQSTFQQHQEEIKSLNEKIVTLEEDLLNAREIQQTASTKVKNIQDKLADAKGYREREFKAASEEMGFLRKKSEESRNKWRNREQEFETLNLEIEELKKSTQRLSQQRQKMLTNVERLKSDLDALKMLSHELVGAVVGTKLKIKELKGHINSRNKELKQVYDRIDNLVKQTQAITLEIKRNEIEVARLRDENKDSFDKIEDFEKKYGWIKEDRKFFGKKNTRYDYSKEDPVEAGTKLNVLEAQKYIMERRVNHKAMTLLDREEEQYQETLRRKKIIEQAKKTIQHIILKMDEKKKAKIDRAWKVIDMNLSCIFGALLPGAHARLSPTVQNNCITGLEIKVGFNGVWKESLDELSGGQRSLIALSLILSMLKFSPAPLYILDEIDAALDMSHTQNIGGMLKAHFTDSQFIIVSLKDAMFQYANVVFTTHFEDGVSAVNRQVNEDIGEDMDEDIEDDM